MDQSLVTVGMAKKASACVGQAVLSQAARTDRGSRTIARSVVAKDEYHRKIAPRTGGGMQFGDWERSEAEKNGDHLNCLGEGVGSSSVKAG